MGTSASQPLSEATAATYRARQSRFGVPDSRLLRVQKDLDSANSAIKTLRKKIARLTKENERLVATNAQLKTDQEDLAAEMDKWRCIAEQHRRDKSELGPEGSAPTFLRSKQNGELFHRPAVMDVHLDELHLSDEVADIDSVTFNLMMMALSTNSYTSKLTLGQQRKVVRMMTPVLYKAGEVIIEEGSHGDDLYIIASGVVHVSNLNGEVKKDIRAGEVFGELALIYNCLRTATIEAKSSVKLYTIDRNTFRAVSKQAKIEEQERLFALFKKMPLLKDLSEDYVADIAATTHEVLFQAGTPIVTQGQQGDNFFLITEGEVEVLQDGAVLRHLHHGDHFGEGALLEAYNIRTATCRAVTEVTCATLNREAFVKYIVPLEALGRLSYLDMKAGDAVQNEKSNETTALQISKESLVEKRLLGVGGFGQVSLVYHEATKKHYALKAIAKSHIIATGQEDYVVMEKKVMMALCTPFCVPLYQTYKDSRCIYLLSEALLGGELWQHLRQADHFSESRARFYAGCVIEAIAYLHSLSIVYRDLKPENVLMDARGYVKLVDFGFARKLQRNKKTWTFCGTPEYMAPEIVMNQGHDRGVDYWALGVLLYELMSGRTPFVARDPMDTYNLIIMGIDNVKFHPNITPDARDLILNLCRDDPSDRVGRGKNGAKAIMNHRWFKGFSWQQLRQQVMPPPFTPKLTDSADCRYFDKVEPRGQPPVVGDCPWDKEF